MHQNAIYIKICLQSLKFRNIQDNFILKMKHDSLKIKWFSRVLVLVKICQVGSFYTLQEIENRHNENKKFDGSLKYTFIDSCITRKAWMMFFLNIWIIFHLEKNYIIESVFLWTNFATDSFKGNLP